MFLKKLYLTLIIIAIASTGCTSTKRNINDRPQTFTEFVILNKYHKDTYGTLDNTSSFDAWSSMNSDSFPGLRAFKYFESEVISNEEN